jgi:hypothetical protein
VNEYSPTEYSVLSDFQLASFEGYSSIVFSSGTMNPPVVLNGLVVSTYSLNPISWPNNGNAPTYLWGIVVSSVVSGNVIFAVQLLEAFQLNPNQTFQFNLILNVSL